MTVSESGLLVRVTNTTTTQSTTSPVAGDGSFVASVGAEGGDRIALVVVDPAGNSSAPRDLEVPGAPSVPADPALGAPAVDPKQPSTICDTLSFLFSGPGALQRGGAADGVDCARAAWLRGRVVDRSGAPLAGVRVAVPGQPQIGTTLTRADGAYDLIVNGGGGIVLRFAASGHPVAERRTDVPWGGSRVLDEIRLVSFDSASTAVDLAQISETTPARGSSTTDPDGTRQATLLFAAGTTAVLDHGSGSEEPISSLTVRATEYTVGADGPSSMPAELPPTSAYTYAVELSVDEAEAAGAKSVRFSRPVPVYVEDFLGFPTGTVVPAATYDRDRHVWVPTTDGRVVEILSISAGRVDLDLTGSGQPATGQELAALGIDDGERQALAALYPVGQKLWRVPVDHFSAYDFNFPVTLPDGASAPGTDKPESDDKTDKPNCQHGSIIECENQVLGETLPIAGTPFALHYRSDRVPGRAAARHLDVPLAGPDGLPADVQEVRIDIQVAGKQQTATLPASGGTFSYDWDGEDALGRALTGRQPYTARIGYTYSADYAPVPPGCTSCFGLTSTGSVSFDPAREKATLWQTHSGRLGVWDFEKAVGLGGWTITPHHVYDPVEGILYLGDGTWRKPEGVQVITTQVGDGTWGSSGDGGPAVLAQVSYPVALRCTAEDGACYFLDSQACRLRKIGGDGTISTVAGSSCPDSPYPADLSAEWPGDGLPATQVRLAWPNDFTITDEGTIYISDQGHGLIRWIDEEGVIWSAVGGHPRAANRPGDLFLPVSGMAPGDPAGVAVGPDGALYVSRNSGAALWGTVQRYDLEHGLSRCVLGCGALQNCSQDPDFRRGIGGLASETYWVHPKKLRFTRDGDLLVVDSGGPGNPEAVIRVDRRGFSRREAGTCQVQSCGTPICWGASPDGVRADEAVFGDIKDVSEGWDGSIFVTDKANHVVRRIDPDGILSTAAGTGVAGFNGDSFPATATQLSFPEAALALPDGSILVLDTGNRRIRRLEDAFPPMPEQPSQTILVPAEDGRSRYVFDGRGRHLRTEDAQTGQVLLTFGYNPDGYLTSITDAFGNTTTIERDGSDVPQAIVAPFGQRTTLEANDPEGYLSAVEDPAAERVEMTYWPGGLLKTLKDPKVQTHSFAYDSLGRLEHDEDPLTGFSQLDRTTAAKEFTVTATTAMGRVTTYRSESLAGDRKQVTTTHPDGSVTVTVRNPDGSTSRSSSDGTSMSSTLGPDPRFGMAAPVATSVSVSTPGGITATATSERTVTFVNPAGDPQDPANVASIVDQATVNGRTITSSYDATTRTLTTTSPMGRQGSTTFDLFGRVAHSNSPGLPQTHLGYDARGRLSDIDQGTRNTHYEYDPNGFVESVRDPFGRTVHFTYDAVGRVKTQTLPDSRVLSFDYDVNGNLTSITPPGRPAHAFDHDADDQTTLYDPPDVGLPLDTTVYAYNLDHQLERVTRPDGQTIDYVYGPATGRLDSLVTPRGTYSYGYDATSGNLTSVADPDGGSLAFAYDGSLPTSVTWAGTVAGSVGYGYDDSFELTSRTLDEGDPVAFAYDDDGLLTAAGDLTLDHDPATGFLTGSTLATTTDEITYTSYGELDTYTARFNGSSIYGYDTTRDDGGRIVSKSETIGGVTALWEYHYDPAGRLDQVKKDGVVVETFGYDDNSNRTSWTDFWGTGTATYDDQDRLSTYGPTSYTYTANGELLTKTAGPDTTTYGYDVLGNLRTVTLPTGVQIEYLIDAANRRIGKKVDGTLVSGFLWQSQLQPAAELDGSGNVVAEFVYATRANVPDYLVKNGTTYRIFADHLGSVRLVVDAQSGADRPAPRLRRLRPDHLRLQPGLPALRLRRRPLRPPDRPHPLRRPRLRPRDRAMDQ